METLESSRVCRLCGKHSGISINIFDKNENHVKKINAILPIMVHEMDLLPKHMCHRCSYKLEEFHKFYVDCLKTDTGLKSQLSWMRKEDSKERVGVPMVHIENIKIKVEPPDYDLYDVNPIVDNVDYISSVTFPVNGVQPNDIPERITYTAYTRCGCYCDKADQSSQAVPTNYESRMPKCSRINDVRPHNNGCVNDLGAVRANLANRISKKKANLVRFNDAKDLRTCRSTSSSLPSSKSKSSNADGEASRCTLVHNLRPRRGVVDYVGNRNRKKVLTVFSENDKNRSQNKDARTTEIDVRHIKVEKLDDYEGRILRPRKGTIDYIGPKRKCSRSMNKDQRSQSDAQQRLVKTKVRNIASKLKLPSKKMSKLWENPIKAIKKEQLSDLENMLDESIPSDMLSPNCTDNPTDQMDALPSGYRTNVQNDRVNCSTFSNGAQDVSSLNLTEWKEASKRKINRIDQTNYSPRYLRSQDVCLRNGKVRKLENTEVSARKLRRTFRNLTGKGRTTCGDLMKVLKGTVSARKMSSVSMKLIDIKHYCEECNTTFANKELFKLHACYGH